MGSTDNDEGGPEDPRVQAASPRADRWRAIIAIVLLVLLGGYTFTHLDVTADITHFLPSSEDRQLARISREITSSELNRTLTLTLEAPGDRALAARAGRALADRLRERPEVSWVRSGPGEDLNETFYQLYFPRRLLFLSDEPGALEEGLLSDEGLAAAALDVRSRLLATMGTFIRQLAPQDPLMAFVRRLESMRRSQGGELEIIDGQFMTLDGERSVLFLASVNSAFDSTSSRALMDGLDADFAAIDQEYGGGLILEQSGVHRFALSSEAAIRADVQRISMFSTLGVLLFFLLLFRSPRYLFLGMLPIVAGMVVGLSVTQALFGRVHGLSLAFGGTLIGVGIDYVIHYLNHHALTPSASGPKESLRQIWPGLVLGALTTVAGLSGLAWTSFPGIQELSVFTSAGVITALLATRYLLPPFMPHRPKVTPLHRRISNVLSSLLEMLRARRWGLVLLPVTALAVCAIGLPQVSWQDDVRALNTLDPVLVAEDERVRTHIGQMESGRMVLAWGSDEEQALQRNDEVFRRLRASEEAGELEGFRSVHDMLWSAELQEQNMSALRASPHLVERMNTALAEAGMVPSLFSPFAEALAEEPEPLTFADLRESPVGPLIQNFRIELPPLEDGEEGRIAFLSFLRGGELSTLEDRLSGLQGVAVFDQMAFMQEAYGAFRSRTLELMGLGLLVVFGIVLIRYRKLSLALAAFLPAVLAAATALAVLALLGYQANLMHLTALLLVLSMGVDYGVFMVESRSYPEGASSTLVSLVLACVSTVLSFGLLALSVNPAMRALGLVTAVGIMNSLLLAPAAWLLMGDAAQPQKTDEVRSE